MGEAEIEPELGEGLACEGYVLLALRPLVLKCSGSTSPGFGQTRTCTELPFRGLVRPKLVQIIC